MNTTELKAEIFDILIAISNSQNNLKQLEQLKELKLQELQQKIEQENSSVMKKEGVIVDE